MLVYCKPLVEDGRVYKAIPPLYGTKINGKQVYFGNKIDYTKYIQKLFVSESNITDINGNKISDMELTKIFMINEDYVFELERIAKTFALDPLMLETLLLNRVLPFAKLKSVISKQFRFVKDIRQIQDTIYVDGLVNGKINTGFLNDKLIKASEPILDILGNNELLYFKLNNKPVGLYEFMSAFEKHKPNSIERYKGLGEMSGKKLRESTLDPEGSRLIVRYTAKSIEDEIQTLRYLNSNMNLIGDKYKVTRLDLMD